MESTSLDAKLTMPGEGQNINSQNNDNIECSVCGEMYDHITEYTHHLNMHLNSVQPANDGESSQELNVDLYNYPSTENVTEDQSTNDIGSSHKNRECGLTQIETSPFEIKVELQNETEDNMELNMDLENGESIKKVGNSQTKCESNLREPQSDSHLKTKLESKQKTDGNILTTENVEISQKWESDFDESEIDSLFNTKQESQTEAGNKEGFDETSKQKTGDAVNQKVKPFTCTSCDQSFSQKAALTAHVNAVHRMTLFTCTLCDKTFSYRSNLSRHMDVVHKKLTPFSCTLCDKSFSRKGYLSDHVAAVHDINAVHGKLKPFSCTFCNKSFTVKSSLTKHVYGVHKKLKSFSCTLCDKSFLLRGHLSEHVAALHDKSFSCTLCNKSFSSKKSLRVHVDTVHNKLKPFSCTFCEKSFGCKSNLKRHIAGYHKAKLLLCQNEFYTSTTVDNSQGRWENDPKPIDGNSLFDTKGKFPAHDTNLDSDQSRKDIENSLDKQGSKLKIE